MLANINQNRIKKLNKFIESSEAGFIVLEISEIPLQQEIINNIQNSTKNILLINLKNVKTTEYLHIIEKSKSDIVIITNFLSAFTNTEDCCKEINGNRDLYRSYNKIMIFMIEPCVVDYLILKCMSFWSCVELHENFTTLSFNPFLYKSMLNYSINSKKMDLKSFLEREICNNINCKNDYINCKNNYKNFKPDFCYYFNSKNENFDIVKWINSCVKVGDYSFENGDFQSALNYYSYANKLLTKEKLNSSSSYIRWRIANTFCQLGQYDKAIFIFNELIKLEKRDLLLSQLFNDLGITLLISSSREDEKKKLAYECLKKSKDILEEYEYHDVKEYLKKIYYNLALFYYNDENLKCCVDYVERLNNLNDYSTQFDFDYYFFNLFIKIKYGNYFCMDLTDNFKYFDNNLFFFDEYYIALFYFICAFYYFSRNLIGKAIKYSKKVEKTLKGLRTEKNFYCVYANTYYLRGVCYYYINDLNESKYCFFKATDLFLKSDMKIQSNKLKELQKKMQW